MKTEEFNKCREFLEQAILNNPDNNEFLTSYQKLIELKSIYDKETDKARIEKEIRETEFHLQHQTAVHGHNTDYNKAAHLNNTNFDIAQNNNQAAICRNGQNQLAGTISAGINRGMFDNM